MAATVAKVTGQKNHTGSATEAITGSQPSRESGSWLSQDLVSFRLSVST